MFIIGGVVNRRCKLILRTAHMHSVCVLCVQTLTSTKCRTNDVRYLALCNAGS